MKITILFILGLSFLGWAWGILSATPENTVIRILDGDTVEIMGARRKPFIVRLQGIDAPENGQPYGKKSKKALSKLIYKKIVKLQGGKHDGYGRRLSRIYVGLTDVSAEMVGQGAAWVYRRYTRDAVLYQAEARAKKGLILQRYRSGHEILTKLSGVFMYSEYSKIYF